MKYISDGEYKMLTKFLRDRKKYCTVMMNEFKTNNEAQHSYWAGQRKAYGRSLREIRGAVSKKIPKY